MWTVLKKTLDEFLNDECPRMAAALAFYTVFSLPAIVIAVVTIVGLLVQPLVSEKDADNDEVAGEKVAGEQLKSFIRETASPEVAKQIEAVLNQARAHSRDRKWTWWAWAGWMAILLYGASGALTEVQTALNRAWSVKPDPKQSVWRYFLVKRLFSLVMLLGIALLLLFLLAVSVGLAVFRGWIDQHAPAWLSSRVTGPLNVSASFIIITLLFAAIFRFVPDVKLAWQDVFAGAIVTAILFVLGKTGLSIYLAWSNPASAYGAAGSVALVLLWIYYSANILFLGAEFTHVLAQRHGKVVEPQEGCVFTESTDTESPSSADT
jgi:membrane protein